MALEFGSTTGSRIEFTTLQTIGAASRATLVMGWWRPTTLTADRRLWAAASIFGFQISSANTARIRHVQDRTTDTVLDTVESILVLNRWVFLAFLCSSTNTVNTTSQEIYYGYSPHEDLSGGSLTRATWSTITAGTGNLTGSTSFRLGNSGLNSAAWQGRIGPVVACISSCPIGVTTHPLYLSAFGAWTADERERLLKDLIEPFYRYGALPRFTNEGTQAQSSAALASNSTQWVQFPIHPGGPVVVRNQGAASLIPNTMTIVDVTASADRCPCAPVYERGILDLGSNHFRIRTAHRR